MRISRLGGALALVLSLPGALAAQASAAKSLPEQIADLMVKANGGIHQGFRFAHAKGLVVTGTFTPAATAKTVSRAAHFQAPVPVTVRLSDGTGLPTIADNAPNAFPRGMAIRFQLPKGGITDIVAISHNGFIVGNGEDFRDLFAAATSTTPQSPHPSPIEKFLGAHPRALKFITDQAQPPASFANLGFFGNNAFVFVDAAGTKRAGRYFILPAEGIRSLDSAAAAKMGPNYLFDDLAKRLAKGPIKYTLYVQLANPGDQTSDGSLVWPDDRKKVEIGTLSLTTVAPDNAEAQRKLMYSPILLTDGIQLGDDPLPVLRAAVYALSVAHR
ncbi:MAG: catalase family peroxidase [Gemmatimonadales bacterium]